MSKKKLVSKICCKSRNSMCLLVSVFIAIFVCLLSSISLAFSSVVVGEIETYTIIDGDNLYKIARQYGIAYSAIAKANDIINPNLIQIGKVLILPTQFILPAVCDEGIVINIPEFRLYLFRNGEVQAVYPIAVGLSTSQTPIGAFIVINKVKNPAWYMTPDMAKQGKNRREIIPPGPKNPLGAFWIGTSLDHIGMHGTNSPMSVGNEASHGCLRLYPEHIKTLFDEVVEDEIGEILYNPVKVAIDGNNVFIEVHADVYNIISNFVQVVEKQLCVLGVWEKIDLQFLYRVIDEARGIPVLLKTKPTKTKIR